MDIKPTGPERDKQIAELREKVCHHPYRMQLGCTIKKPTKELCDTEQGCIMYRIAPYSTDIACAFELWDEMKDANLDIGLWVDSGPEYRCKCDSEIGAFTGETEADAISGCWLKWKMEG